MEKLIENHSALFRLICSREPTRLGAECKHSPSNNGDDCIPTIDARNGEAYLSLHKWKLADSFQSIYSMGVLPQNAGLVSYIIVTIILCAITYVIVLNLQHLKDAISLARGNMKSTTRKSKVKKMQAQ